MPTADVAVAFDVAGAVVVCIECIVRISYRDPLHLESSAIKMQSGTEPGKGNARTH